MYTLDSWGTVIDSSATIHGTRLMQMANGDLLVYSGINQQLSRNDTLGNTIWSEFCIGYFAYDTSAVYLANSTSSVKKIDAISGVQIWNRNYNHSPISNIKATHDGGFMASVGYRPKGRYGNGMSFESPGYLFRADSFGDTLWLRTYPFPHFGLSDFAIVAGGNILTGGCYLSGLTEYPSDKYSTFCCMMNTDGSYPLAQTNYVSPSDANNDHLSNWVDDVLETIISLGQTGTPRDTSLDGNGGLGQPFCNSSDIAINWPGSSPTGVNYKYSDFDGNGIVDTNDVYALDFCGSWGQDSLILYYRYGNPDIAKSTEEFCIVPVHDTIQPGEDVLYYLIMGNSVNPVDSIYGFALSCFINDLGYDHLDSLASYITDLGNPGIDLLCSQSGAFVTINQKVRNHVLMCRTDFQNANSVYDTVGLIRFSGIFLQSVFAPTIADFKAILADGTEIPFNTCAGTIFIDSSLLSVEEKQNTVVSISPNPTSDFLIVKITIGWSFTILLVST
jgi:hypothetical protein